MINSRDHMGGTQTMQWFCYQRGFDGLARPQLYTKRPEPKHAEGADRLIIEGSLMTVPAGLTLKEAEVYFLTSRGGSFTYVA